MRRRTILVLGVQAADTRHMQYTAASQIPSMVDSVDVRSSNAGRFTQRFALASATIYSVFVAWMVIVDPAIARFAPIWVAWAVVIIVAVGTHAAGGFVRRRTL